jgi:Transposase DDE domain group 1
VHIEQKTVKHTPLDKLYDSFVTLLAGAHGLVEINTLLRADHALQRAFGRKRCAEQSVVQQTLDACTPTQVAQMEQAMEEIYRTHSRGFRHDYRADWQILDVDLCGWLCGKQAAFATKGYFANAARNRRGRQLGRVLAWRYQEVIVDRLFPGNCQLNATLQTLVSAAQNTLQLDAEQRQRTLVRIDAGGGSVPNLNWLLEQGYEVLGKACSRQQSRLLATTVGHWMTDTQVPERQIGWVCEEPTAFVRPVRRVAVRSRKPNGQWGVGVLICSLSDQAVFHLAGVPLEAPADEQMVLQALVGLYDQRGGGIETSFKGDKGIGLTKRNKKRFEAQQMLMLLGSLAHNVIVWAHEWLNTPAPTEPEQAQLIPLSSREPLPHYGPLRMVRDVFHLSGFLRWDACGQLVEIVLNQDALLARRILFSLRQLLAPMHVAINLGQT